MQAPAQAPAMAPGRAQEGPSLATLVEWIDDAEEASYNARQLADRCERYFHHKQLTAEQKKKLAERRQPEVIENMVRRKIKFMLGWEKQTRTDPKAYARNSPDDDNGAEVATDVLRFQEQKQYLDQKLSQSWKDMLLGGFCGVEVLGPSARDPRVIEVKLWRRDRLGYDPHSSEPDFSDAKYLYGITWMDKDEAIKAWPHAKAALERTIAEEVGKSKTYDDKPNRFSWATRGKRERVKIIQIYYREGTIFGNQKWSWCLFTKGGKIDGGPVELLDAQGNPECPLIMQSAYVDEENNRYGEVVEMLSMQDAINKTHSKAQHLMNTSKTVSEQGALLDPDAFKAEWARPDAHVTLQPGALENKRFQVIDNRDDATIHLSRLQDLRSRMELIGANASLQGKQGQSASGRAIRASQEGGLIELTDIKDEHTTLKRRVYQATWNRVCQFLTDEITIAITDNDDSVRYVGINRPVTMYEDLMSQAEDEGIPEEEAQEQIRERIAADPTLAQQLEQVVRVENIPSQMDVDIIIEVSNESINMAEENFQALSNMFPPGSLPPEVILELAPLSPRKKRQVKEMMKPRPADLQRDAEVMGMKADNLSADTEQKRAQAMKARADAGRAVIDAMRPPEIPGAADQASFGF